MDEYVFTFKGGRIADVLAGGVETIALQDIPNFFLDAGKTSRPLVIGVFQNPNSENPKSVEKLIEADRRQAEIDSMITYQIDGIRESAEHNLIGIAYDPRFIPEDKISWVIARGSFRSRIKSFPFNSVPAFQEKLKVVNSALKKDTAEALLFGIGEYGVQDKLRRARIVEAPYAICAQRYGLTRNEALTYAHITKLIERNSESKGEHGFVSAIAPDLQKLSAFMTGSEMPEE